MAQQNHPRDQKDSTRRVKKGDGARSHRRGVYGDILITPLEYVGNDEEVVQGDDVNNVRQDNK